MHGPNREEAKVKRSASLLAMIVALLPALSPAMPGQLAEGELAKSIVPVDLHVSFVPPPFRGDGQLGLAYELRLANFRNIELTLTQVDVFPLEDRTHSLLSLAGPDLVQCLLRPGKPPGMERPELLAGGEFAVVMLWVIMDPGQPVPSSIAHRATFRLVRGDGSKSELPVEGAVIYPPAQTLLPVCPPLGRGRWLMANGPGMLGEHRLFLHSLDGRASNTQRLASDWMLLGPDGRLVKDDPEDNADWYSYGEPVLAVADAIVVDAADGIPENVPLSDERAVPNKRETMTGNYVVLNLAEDTFAFYGHLQPGSVRVQVGDHVRAGQELGRIGNSGNSDAPHLHFHVANGSDPLSGEGLPFSLTSFAVLEVLDVPFWERMLVENEPWEQTVAAEPKLHEAEMPVGEAIIEFR